MSLKFLKQDAHKKKRIKRKWGKPKGLQSKVRLGKKGYRKKVNIGYGRQRSEKIPVVSSVKELESFAKKTVVIAKSVGKRKRLKLVKKSKELGIKLQNIKNVDDYVKKIEEWIEKNKIKRVKKEEKKKAKKKEKVKLEKKIEESDEERKEREKKEKDSLLTKRT